MIERHWLTAYTGCGHKHDPPPVHVYPVHDACKVCRHSREEDSVPAGGGPIGPVSG